MRGVAVTRSAEPSRHARRLRTQARYLRYDAGARRAALWGAGLVVGLGLIWVVVTGLLARVQVHRIENSLRQVRVLFAQGNLAQARLAAEQIPGEAKRARLLTSGPAWWAAAHVPWFGAPLQTVRGATAASVQLGEHGIPELLRVAALMDPNRLRVHGNTIDLAAVRAAQPDLAQATAVLTAAAQRVDRLPHSTWLAAVDHPRASLSGQLHTLLGYVAAADRAARILPTMLGGAGPKRYFIGMQNEAEMRGTGGLPGAFAIAVASHGRVRFTHFASDAELEPVATGHRLSTGLDFGTGYRSAYGSSLPTASFLNSNVSPDFPYAAEIWAHMWQQVSGQRVDGAIAVDPAVLGYVLSVTGPVSLPGGITADAQNIVSLTERDEYTLFPDNLQRKAFLVSVLKATSRRLISGRGSAYGLARTMVAASSQQRLQVWSADPAVEHQLAATTYGGVIGPTARPLVAPILNNLSGGKLDFYLTRTLTYQRSGCGSSRDVLVTLTLTNNAPASGLPPYVTDRLDAAQPPDSQPGDYSTLLDYYATKGAQLLSVRVDGKPTTAALLTVSGQPVFRLSLQLLRGQTQTVELHLQEPPGSGAPLIWQQPAVSPMPVTVRAQPCG